MRIPSRVYHQAVKQMPRPDARDEQREGYEQAAASKADDVKLAVSATAKQLAEDGAIDRTKVERLRAAIGQGFYRIDAGQLANTISETGG